MTAASAQPPQSRGPREFDSPRAIRAALLPEEVIAFDAAYAAALRVAAESLTLEKLQETLAHWRSIVRQTQADPAAHRRMLQQAELRLRTGEEPDGAQSWNELAAELGLS